MGGSAWSRSRPWRSRAPTAAKELGQTCRSGISCRTVSCNTSASALSTATRPRGARDGQEGRSEVVPRFPQVEGGFPDASAPNPPVQPAAPGTDDSFLPRAHGLPVQPGPERTPTLAYAGVAAAPVPTGPALALAPPTPATPSGALAPAGNPSVLPSGVAPLGSRSLARHEARQRNHRLRIVLAALLSLALVASAVWYVANRGHAPKPAAPVATGPDSVVLLQVTGANGAAGAALLGDQHGAAGAVVLVPTQLAVDSGGFGGVSLQKAATLPGRASADGVADALGIRVDGTWTLTVGGLAALVDRLGGIDADVDVQVKQGAVIKVPAGQQHLDGVAAAAYATYSVPGEPAQAQLARLDTVLEAVIGGFADKPSAATQQIAALGASSQSSLQLARLGAVLAHLRALDAADTLVYRSLPVHDLDSGTGVATYTVDTAGAAEPISDLTGRRRRQRGERGRHPRPGPQRGRHPRARSNGTRKAQQGGRRVRRGRQPAAVRQRRDGHPDHRGQPRAARAGREGRRGARCRGQRAAGLGRGPEHR